jgi:deoxyribodipyrimidine photo-lyase
MPPCARALPKLGDIGFAASDLDRLGVVAGSSGAHERLKDFLGRIDDYGSDRDFPARDAPSRLSVHLRFGTVSIRELAGIARQLWEHEFSVGAGVWLNELIWRDFYFMVLDHRPDVVHACFRPQFDGIVWDDWEEGLRAWREGCTGYPLVDAAMRQLRHTGYMHNRLRMLAASFLTKDLGIDWRFGERHFAEHLLDYDLAANNGGWQWAASTGCDAQPYFRIFNPLQQSIKFDPGGDFIRRYCPELAPLSAKSIHAPWLLSAGEQQAAGLRIGADYPLPIVDHGAARQRTLDRFKAVRAG